MSFSDLMARANQVPLLAEKSPRVSNVLNSRRRNDEHETINAHLPKPQSLGPAAHRVRAHCKRVRLARDLDQLLLNFYWSTCHSRRKSKQVVAKPRQRPVDRDSGGSSPNRCQRVVLGDRVLLQLAAIRCPVTSEPSQARIDPIHCRACASSGH